MPEPLALWMYETRVATISTERRRLRLRYSEEALDTYPGGTPLLSLSLPLSAESLPNHATRAFLDGLLPEGEPRRMIAEDLGLRADDTFRLISALGRDCAGAIVIQPESHAAPPPVTTTTAEPLDEGKLLELIANLRTVPLGVDDRVRISLAGVQEKLLLTRLPDGRWGRPVDGTPSTHILKPDIRGYPNTVRNEAFCMRLAAELGIVTAHIEVAMLGERPVLVVERYDRAIDSDGHVERIHQEDLCQATGALPGKKYQEDGGPSLWTLADILRAIDPGSLERLLKAVLLNVIVGNGDAHAKNYSLLHERSGCLRLSPLYDVLSTFYYEDRRLAMYIDDVRRTDRVTVERIANEAFSWGISRRRSAAIIQDVLDRLPQALELALERTPGVPEQILKIVEEQVASLTKHS